GAAREARGRFGARIWRLEWGLYADWDEANKKVEELIEEGYAVKRQAVRDGGDLLYAVRSGGYDTRAEAQAVVNEMGSRGDKPRIVVAADDR
ncbi:MAG TPA: SPOR domain-containing protein, partial [bacterium]